MSSPFFGEIRAFGFGFSPRGWAYCQGQLLAIQQNAALYSLLGTSYGGDGRTTFGLPDFRGRSPVHIGQGAGLSAFALGAKGGASLHTLTSAEMPPHTHTVNASDASADRTATSGNTWAQSAQLPYSSTAPSTALSSSALTTTGSGLGHSNEQPYLVLNFCIALQGVYPSRS